MFLRGYAFGGRYRWCVYQVERCSNHGFHDTVGIELVEMNVNDLVVQSAKSYNDDIEDNKMI